MKSIERCQELRELVGRVGEAEAMRITGLKGETLGRYCRIGSKPIEKGMGAPPKVLIFDIETTPTLAYIWRYWKENISPGQIVEDSVILCWAAKWLGSSGVMFNRSKNWRNDKELTASLAELLGSADLVVAHNGKAFDIARIWSQMAKYEIDPPAPFKVVDTCLLARSAFAFPHNSLDGLARYLNLGGKTEHEGLPLWKKCMSNDEDAWARMEEYNINDVLLLEKVYLRLRQYDKRHPNMSLYWDDDLLRCVCCGSTAVKMLPKSTFAQRRVYPAYRCKSCGKIMRSNIAEKRSKEGLVNVL